MDDMRLLLQSSLLTIVLALFIPAELLLAQAKNGGNQSCPSGMSEVAKFEGNDLTEGATKNGVTIDNLQYKDKDKEVIAGDWASTSELMAVVVKGGRQSVIDHFEPTTSGTFSNDGLENGGGKAPGISNMKFCAAGACEASTFDEDVNREERTVTLTISNSEGISTVDFTTLEGFTVHFMSSSNGSTFAGDATGGEWSTSSDAYPTDVTFELRATEGAEESTYFANVTSDCKGGFTTYLDPVHSFPELSASRIALDGNAPNPFREQTTIRFTLSEATDVRLSVYDVMGRKVATLVDRTLTAGVHDVQWNGRSGNGHRLPSGTYFYRLEAGAYSTTQSMVRVR